MARLASAVPHLAVHAIKALLWDVDGTLCEAERDGHRVAFNQAFSDFGLPWTWSDSRYGELLPISNVRERLLRDMFLRQDAPVQASVRDALARQLHARKNERYAELLATRTMTLRGGVAALVDECLASGVRLGIVTGTNRSDLDVLLSRRWGGDWSRWFSVVVCGADVECGNPAAEFYVRALQELRLVPLEVVAIEDCPAGAAAARAVDISVVVTRGARFEHARFPGAIAVGPGLDQRRGWQPTLERCAGSVGRVELTDIRDWAIRASERAGTMHRVA